jgi:hypothetical protein
MSNDACAIRVVPKDRIQFNPPPAERLADEIANTLRDYPEGLAESIVDIDGRQIFFICGPRLKNTIEIHVWERDEIEAVYNLTHPATTPMASCSR